MAAILRSYCEPLGVNEASTPGHNPVSANERLVPDISNFEGFVVLDPRGCARSRSHHRALSRSRLSSSGGAAGWPKRHARAGRRD
jgi:hypothetical protein